MVELKTCFGVSVQFEKKAVGRGGGFGSTEHGQLDAYSNGKMAFTPANANNKTHNWSSSDLLEAPKKPKSSNAETIVLDFNDKSTAPYAKIKIKISKERIVELVQTIAFAFQQKADGIDLFSLSHNNPAPIHTGPPNKQRMHAAQQVPLVSGSRSSSRQGVSRISVDAGPDVPSKTSKYSPVIQIVGNEKAKEEEMKHVHTTPDKNSAILRARHAWEDGKNIIPPREKPSGGSLVAKAAGGTPPAVTLPPPPPRSQTLQRIPFLDTPNSPVNFVKEEKNDVIVSPSREKQLPWTNGDSNDASPAVVSSSREHQFSSSTPIYNKRELPNLTNSCYLNATMQALSACPSMLRRLRSFCESSRHKPSLLIRRMMDVLDRLDGDKSHDHNCFMSNHNLISALKEVLGNVYVQFNNTRQQDAQELLACLLDYMAEECKKAKEAYGTGADSSNLSNPTECMKISIGQRLVCPACKKETEMSDTNTCLMLSLDMEARVAPSLLDLLARELTAEKLDERDCGECGARGIPTMFRRIQQTPDHIIVVVKRFEFIHLVGKKVNTVVLIPMWMCLDDYTIYGHAPTGDDETATPLLPLKQEGNAELIEFEEDGKKIEEMETEDDREEEDMDGVQGNKGEGDVEGEEEKEEDMEGEEKKEDVEEEEKEENMEGEEKKEDVEEEEEKMDQNMEEKGKAREGMALKRDVTSDQEEDERKRKRQRMNEEESEGESQSSGASSVLHLSQSPPQCSPTQSSSASLTSACILPPSSPTRSLAHASTPTSPLRHSPSCNTPIRLVKTAQQRILTPIHKGDENEPHEEVTQTGGFNSKETENAVDEDSAAHDLHHLDPLHPKEVQKKAEKSVYDFDIEEDEEEEEELRLTKKEKQVKEIMRHDTEDEKGREGMKENLYGLEESAEDSEDEEGNEEKEGKRNEQNQEEEDLKIGEMEGLSGLDGLEGDGEEEDAEVCPAIQDNDCQGDSSSSPAWSLRRSGARKAMEKEGDKESAIIVLDDDDVIPKQSTNDDEKENETEEEKVKTTMKMMSEWRDSLRTKAPPQKFILFRMVEPRIRKLWMRYIPNLKLYEDGMGVTSAIMQPVPADTRPGNVVAIVGDGNCLFRALSWYITGGNQEYHQNIRHEICNFMFKYKAELESRGNENLSIDQHITRMRLDAEWGTHCELSAAATFLGVDIYTFLDEQNRWFRYRPIFEWNVMNNKTTDVFHSTHTKLAIYLQNECYHYNVVTSLCFGEPQPSGHLVYSLAAVINHHGSYLNTGHYTADIHDKSKDAKGKWLRCDDDKTTEQKECDVLNSAGRNGYVFIYSRVKNS